MKEKNVDQIYEYLLRHGEKTPLQLAKALRLDPATVRDALRELEKQDKIRLERPLFLAPTPPRVVPARVPERIKRKVEERVEKARAIQLKVHEKQKEIKRKREQLLTKA
jgi:DNA-binding transcriptional regulator YhcF (GntR family)